MAKVFLGYATFYRGKPFPTTPDTVTRNKAYLRQGALLKLNMMKSYGWPLTPRGAALVERAWKRHAKQLQLTLRRVYAH